MLESADLDHLLDRLLDLWRASDAFRAALLMDPVAALAAAGIALPPETAARLAELAREGIDHVAVGARAC